MKIVLTLLAAFLFAEARSQKAIPLFDGRSFKGWEGDTVKTWRIQDGALVGGSLIEMVPHNEFLATTREFKNFILRLKFRLLDTKEVAGNSGIQFHSQRIANPPNEMTGYQADLGEGFWASLYDESRRNKTLVRGDTNVVKQVLKQGGWNDYEVRAENGRIRIKLNGKLTVDYREPDATIPQSGLIAIQIHGGAKAEIWCRDVTITELP